MAEVKKKSRSEGFDDFGIWKTGEGKAS